MGIVWFLVPAALFLGLGFLALFVWSVRDHQFEDLDTPAVRILLDEKLAEKEQLK